MSVRSVWVGDSTCYGYYASTLDGRYSSITSRAMGWDELNFSVPGSGYTVPGYRTFGQQLAEGASQVPDPQSVSWVLIMGGVNDAGWNRDPDEVAKAVVAAVAQARSSYPQARVVVGVEPTVHSMDADRQQARVAMAKVIQDAAGKVADLVIPGMMDVCGADESLRSDEWHPNSRGHQLIAGYILRHLDGYDPGAGHDDVGTVRRRYAPGRADAAANEAREQIRREREKSEANRPTGTEIDQTSAKLKAVTAQLKAQQEQLEQQQESLERQQEDILRTTPVFSTYQGSSPGGALGGGWSQLVSLHVRRDATHGKRNAILLISVSAVKTGDGMPLLKCLAGGGSAGVFPGVTANGDDFGGTSSTSIGGDVDVVLYGRSTVDGASPVGSVAMKVTVISLA